MKRILILSSILLSVTVQSRTVLVTSFEPFGGREINGSHTTATGLGLRNDESVTYVNCLLPVEFNLAAEKAIECYERMNPKPDMVVSLGENNCNIKLESKYFNHDVVEPGIGAPGRTIDVNATPYEFSTLPIAEMICESGTDLNANSPYASTYAGYFVCNNTAYRLTKFYKERNIPYGFIHVPQSDCDVDFNSVTHNVDQLIRTGVRTLENALNPAGPLACADNSQFVLRDFTELASLANHACLRQVRSDLGSLLSPPPYARQTEPGESAPKNKP